MKYCKQLLDEKWVLPVYYFSAETSNNLEKLNYWPNLNKH
jgi:hypothetical protein